MKKFICILILIFMLIPTLTSCGTEKQQIYENAIDLLEAGEYAKAKSYFEDLGNYKNAQKILSHFHDIPVKYFEDGKLICEVKLSEKDKKHRTV